MLNEVQFRYERLDTGGTPLHQVTAHHEDLQVGAMSWNARGVHGIETQPGFKRHGIATGMWREGQRLAQENARIPAPRHSPDRTIQGDAWAKAVGGRVPRRRNP